MDDLVERIREMGEHPCRAHLPMGAELREAATALERQAELIESAFREGLWAGWQSGRAGETMTNPYARKSWEVSDARATLGRMG